MREGRDTSRIMVQTNPLDLLPAVEDAATGSLMNLMNAVSSRPSAPTIGFTPPVPESLADAGLSGAVVEQLILKHLHVHEEIIGRDLSDALGLRFSLIDGVLENLKRHHLVQVKGSLGYGSISAVFALSEAGRLRARDSLD